MTQYAPTRDKLTPHARATRGKHLWAFVVCVAAALLALSPRSTAQLIENTARVNYGLHKVAVFSDQIMATPMSEGGDSGSVVLSDDKKIIGLLFAGGNGGTIINRIQNVFAALDVTLA